MRDIQFHLFCKAYTIYYIIVLTIITMVAEIRISSAWQTLFVIGLPTMTGYLSNEEQANKFLTFLKNIGTKVKEWW